MKLGKYNSLESWASRLGYVVEKTESGYLWHSFDEPGQKACDSPSGVVEAILGMIRSEYEGES